MIGHGGQGFCYDGRKATLFQRVAMGEQGSKIVQTCTVPCSLHLQLFRET